MDADLDSKIQSKKIELEEAQKIVDKYKATIPLNVSDPVGHDAKEMKRDYENYNNLLDEYMSLKRQKRDKR
jgi:hypothetical protein